MTKSQHTVLTLLADGPDTADLLRLIRRIAHSTLAPLVRAGCVRIRVQTLARAKGLRLGSYVITDAGERRSRTRHDPIPRDTATTFAIS